LRQPSPGPLLQRAPAPRSDVAPARIFRRFGARARGMRVAEGGVMATYRLFDRRGRFVARVDDSGLARLSRECGLGDLWALEEGSSLWTPAPVAAARSRAFGEAPLSGVRATGAAMASRRAAG
jgi:hypothetical protein